MKIRYSNAIQDVIAFQRYNRAHSSTHRALMAFTRWGLPGLVILATPFLVFTSWAALALWLLPAVVLMVGTPLLIDAAMALVVRTTYREGNNKGVFGPHELEVSPPDLIERNVVGEQRLWLGAVEKVGTSPSHAFVYVSSLSAHVIPRAAVTDGDYDAFVKALTQEVEKAKRDGQARI